MQLENYKHHPYGQRNISYLGIKHLGHAKD